MTFNGGTATMVITVIVPKQYETVLISFEGAQSNAAVFDSTAGVANDVYWTVDAGARPCYLTIRGEIPVRMFLF